MKTQELLQKEVWVPAVSPAPATTVTVGSMLQAVIEKGVTSENVAAFAKLVDLHERMQEKEAERQFAAAFVALQSEMPSIKAMKAVPNNDGTARYMFAPYEEIMEQVAPMLQKHGFTVTFSTEIAEGRMTKICTLQHVSGHKRQNSFSARIGKGPPGCTETQADGAASTYAKRFVLCDALNITIEKEDDPRALGSPINAAKAEELQRRVLATGSNELAFLKLAGVAVAGQPNIVHYQQILDGKYGMLTEMLAKKERLRDA